jgi:hypothetical protein
MNCVTKREHVLEGEPAGGGSQQRGGSFRYNFVREDKGPY